MSSDAHPGGEWPRFAALIVAAGKGVRAGGAVPKQYQMLAGEPVIRHSLRRLAQHPRIHEVRAVIAADDAAAYEAAAAGLAVGPPVVGGATRQASVRRGLEALADAPPHFVLVHDAARPLLPTEVIDRLIAVAEELTPEAVLPCLPLVDTIKERSLTFAKYSLGQVQWIEATLDRVKLARAQTPQLLEFSLLLSLHRWAEKEGKEFTDEAALIQDYEDYMVVSVEGDERLAKITNQGDLARLEALYFPREIRVGTGFDVHRLEAGRKLVLCGLEIPHSQGLAGHSDADVGIHALCDAIYGALAEGDIGAHFPPTEACWRDADSAIFLRHAAERIAARGGRLVNADVTLVCETPRIRPHAEAMRARLAGLLGADVARVGVKATTTERLGFAGRGEGIAAQAAVSIALPAA